MAKPDRVRAYFRPDGSMYRDSGNDGPIFTSASGTDANNFVLTNGSRPFVGNVSLTPPLASGPASISIVSPDNTATLNLTADTTSVGGATNTAQIRFTTGGSPTNYAIQQDPSNNLTVLFQPDIVATPVFVIGNNISTTSFNNFFVGNPPGAAVADVTSQVASDGASALIRVESNKSGTASDPTVPRAFIVFSTNFSDKWQLSMDYLNTLTFIWNPSSPAPIFKIQSTGITVSGSVNLNTTPVGSNYDIQPRDTVVLATAGGISMRLPRASAAAGRHITVKDKNGHAFSSNITVSGAVGDTIDGASTTTISGNYGVVRVISDGASSWSIV